MEVEADTTASGQSSVTSASFTVGGFELEGYAMTLSAFSWNIARTYILTPGRRFSFGCRYRLGTASNLVMYVSAADNDYVGVTGTFFGTAAQGVWSTARMDFSSQSCTRLRLQPEHPKKDQVRLVVMDVCIREAAVLNKNAKTVGQATKRATQELVGDDKNFVVTNDLGSEFATPIATYGHCGPGHPGPGHARGPQARVVERPL